MDGFLLFCGHLAGDYIVQCDWMAKYKVMPHPGRWLGPKRPYPGPHSVDVSPDNLVGFRQALEERNEKIDAWDRAEAERVTGYIAWEEKRRQWRLGHLACLLHCLLYTLAVWLFSWHWMPWWGLLVVFGLHFPIDRWRLAAWWMKNVSGQAFFASKDHPMFPWSIVAVDNTFHLLTLAAVAVAAGRVH